MSRKGINDQPIDVLVPRDPPELTPTVARLLLDILIELTGVPVLEETAHDG